MPPVPSLEPDIAVALESVPSFVFDEQTLPILRTLMPTAGDAPDDIDRDDCVADGEVIVQLSVHRPRDAANLLPCIYWIHGGGLVSGNRHMDNVQLERWCRNLTCSCVSVEYRLAPEHPYPAALDDCWTGLAWVIGHAAELGIDASRIGLGGRSAGGGLAAAVSMLARRRASRAPSFLLLDYPMLDDRQRTPSSRLASLPVWSRESNRFGWLSYLGEQVGSEAVSELAAPARATDLTDLPPTCVIVGGADGFRDESIEFARRLMQASVSTELHVYPGAPHGFFELCPASDVTRRATRDVEEWLRRRFEVAATP
jgi:acetyl esterase/lipase